MWSPPRLILNNEIANNALTDAFYTSTPATTTRGRRGLKGRQKSKSSGASPQKYPYDEGGEVYEFINVIETSGGGGCGYLDYYEEEDGDFLRLWSRSGSNASGLLQVPSTQTLFEEWQQQNSSSQQRTQRSSSITVPIQRRSMEGVDRMGGMVGGGSGSLFIKRRCSSASPKRRNSNNNNVLGQLVQQPSLCSQFHGELRRASQISSTLSEKRRRRRRSSGALTRRQSFAGGASGAWSSSSSSSLSSPSSPLSSKKPMVPSATTATTKNKNKASSGGNHKRSHHRPSGFSSNSTNNTRSSGESGNGKSIHRLKKPQQRPSYDVVIIGSPNVGKSSLASTFSKSYAGLSGVGPSGGISSSGSDQGIGSDEEEDDEEDCHDQDLCPGKAVTYHPPGHSFTLRIFPQTTSALPHLYKYEGVILLYSVTCRDSFAFARSALRSMPPSKAVLLVANKSDLERSRVVSQLEGRSLATAYDTKFIEISSSLEIGIDALHRGLAAQISLRAKLNSSTINSSCPPVKNSHPFHSSSVTTTTNGTTVPFNNKPTSATRAKLTALLNKLVSLKGGRGSSKSCLDLHSL